MKIGIFSIPDITPGKYNVKDSRLDEVDKIVRPKKKTYCSVEMVGEDGLKDADAILTLKGSLADLILKDLEFVETRLTRAEGEQEKVLLGKLKGILEKESLVFSAQMSEEEKKSIAPYGLLTDKPVISREAIDPEGFEKLLVEVTQESGYISFLTAGEKEGRAWLIKNGASAWEASGAIHSDIQKGFIRAEVISFNDFIQAGGETQAKQAGKMRLEPKEYVMQDADIVNFRFNK